MRFPSRPAIALLTLLAFVAGGPVTSAWAASDEIGDEGFLAAPLEDGGVEARSLSPDEIALLTRIENYLNDFSTVQGRFVQLSSEGSFAEGTVYLQRPGKMRFEYDPPTPVLLIANGHNLLYYDKELKSATIVPLDETPLWFLMQPTISFEDRIVVTDINEELSTVGVTVQPDDEDGPAGAVTLIFSERPMSLRKWVVTDAQGVTIQVSLLDPRFDVPLEDKLFSYSDLDVFGTERGGPMR
ncbi:MAG: outer membrane lipoprotein carrier protein LolA [Kiloniellales bacterium]